MSLRPLALVLSSLALSCAGPTGPAGPSGPAGPEGPKGDPGDDFMAMRSISSVTPTKLAAGVTADVVITGYATSWTNTAQVSFGQGVTVNSVKVGSATGLVANVTVAANAMTGTRDITVTQGNVMSTFPGIFTLVPYFEIRSVGTPMRGGIARFEVRSNDPEFAFPGDPMHVTATVTPAPMMGRVVATVTTPTPRLLAVDVAANLTATLTNYTVTLTFGGREIVLPPFDLADKVELPLTDTAPITMLTLEPNEKKLIKYTGAMTPVPATLHVSIGTAATNVRLVLLDSNGEPVDTSGSSGLPAPGNDLVVTAESTGTNLLIEETAGRRTENITVTVITNSVGEAEPNDDSASAQPLTFGAFGPDMGVRVAANASSFSDSDWYKVTIAAGDVGKRIHVRVFALAYIWFDTQILGPTGGTFATSDINNKTTDYYSAPITEAGEYSLGFAPDTSGDYHLTISIQ